MGIKNLWSLNIDEALAADKLKQEFDKKEYEVLFPLNSQLKDIDLFLINLRKNKLKTIQVKGSRTYDPLKSEILKYGDGSGAWFKINRRVVFEPTNKIDCFIFVLHNCIDGENKKEIKIDFLIIPLSKLQAICLKKKCNKNKDYNFFIWIDRNNLRSFDFYESKNRIIQLNEYLNNWNTLK